MSKKTEYSYNEDDFIEKEDSLTELTVTITLAEYRNLLIERTSQESTIENLQEKVKTLESRLSTFVKIVAADHPELFSVLNDVITSIFSPKDDSDGS